MASLFISPQRNTKAPNPPSFPSDISIAYLPLSPLFCLLEEMILHINLQLLCWICEFLGLIFSFLCLIWFISLEHYLKACSLFLKEYLNTVFPPLLLRAVHGKTVFNIFCLWWTLPFRRDPFRRSNSVWVTEQILFFLWFVPNVS